ncbi:MAG: hypothetical protein EBQ92_01285, partial [Proteobacteria bacterium]|nr:hypothetical protein [Pseudomonadota bacterium]
MQILFVLLSLFAFSNANVVEYSPYFFNQLGDFMDVYQFSHNSSLIESIGMIFVKHGMTERKLSLQLLHTHFKIEDDEIIVEKMTHNESFTMPVKISSVKAHDVSPYLFKFTPTGNVIPLEYVEHSKYLTGGNMEAKISLISDNTSPFVQDMVRFLLSEGLINVFGVGIPHRNHIGDLSGGATTENSNSVERWYRVTPKTTPSYENHRPTVKNKEDCTHGCAHSCSSHVNSTMKPTIKSKQDCAHGCAHSCSSHVNSTLKPTVKN